VFECEDFPQENQKLANKQRPNGLTKISNVFYTMLPLVFYLSSSGKSTTKKSITNEVISPFLSIPQNTGYIPSP